MVKATLLILSLLSSLVALSVPSPAAAQAGGEKGVQVASAAADLALSRGLDISQFDLPDTEELLGDADDFDLKLPEMELPDSDIPLTFNSKVEYFIRYFQGPGRSAFSRWLSRSERYIPMMKKVLRKEGLPEDLVYLAMIESGFLPHALSVARAVGPWQFMPATGRAFDLRIDHWIDERRDPLKSTIAAALYLKELYALFNNDWYLAAAGYNAGENKILRAINMYNSRDFWELSKGGYLKRETKDYVPKLLAAAIIAKEPARHGFADIAYLPPIEFDVVKVSSRTDLDVVAKVCGVEVEAVKELNPELRRGTTPPNYPGYELKIPKGMKAKFEDEYAKLPESERYVERVTTVKYRAKKRDTLASIARRFNTTPQAIAELNDLGSRKKIRGKLLTVPVQVASAETKAPENGQAEVKETPEAKEKPEAKGGPGTGEKAKQKDKPKEIHKYYTVKKGDTLHSLAKRFNVPTRLLTAWNNLKSKVALKPGRRIIVAKYHEKDGSRVKQSG